MRRFGVVSAGGILGAALLAQEPVRPAPTPRPPSAQRSKTPAEMESVTGTVKQYREGKSIVIVGPDGKGRKLVLDGTTRIDGPVRRGEAVTAVWMTDSAGRRHANAISAYPRVAAEVRNAASASPAVAGQSHSSHSGPEPTPRETAAAPTATPQEASEDGATTPTARRTPVPLPP